MVADNNRPRPRKGLICLIGLKKKSNVTIDTVGHRLHAPDSQEGHAEEDEGHIHGLSAEVALAEEQRTTHKRDNDRGATYHRDNGNHRAVARQGVVVAEVGARHKESDKRDAPTPREAVGRAARKPQHGGQEAHNSALIEAKPALNKERREAVRRDNILIIQAADSTKKHSGEECPHISIAAKVDALAAAGMAKQEQRHHSKQHAAPLPQIKTLAKEQQRAKKHHNGAHGIDRANDSERQVLDSIVAEEPRREGDGGLQRHK